MFTVENLAVRLGDQNILQNVHFMIDTPGQLVGILGVNGSGKTTLLRAVAGLLPHTGCCLMDGVPLESLSTRCLAQTVSYIPQQSGISVSMSAREVVLMGCKPPPWRAAKPHRCHVCGSGRSPAHGRPSG